MAILQVAGYQFSWSPNRLERQTFNLRWVLSNILMLSGVSRPVVSSTMMFLLERFFGSRLWRLMLCLSCPVMLAPSPSFTELIGVFA